MTSRRGSLCQRLLSQRIHFAKSVAPVDPLCYTSKVPKGRMAFSVNCKARSIDVIDENETGNRNFDEIENPFTCVMKFGGSSVATAERMREVASLIQGFLEERPIIVPSTMGKTTNKLLLAGEKAVSYGVTNVSSIDELSFIKNLHLRTVDELGVDRSVIAKHLEELEQLLKGIAMMKELTMRTKDYLVSFGECMSTRIFAACLNKIGVKACQYDAFEIGFITTDDFTNADILEATYPAMAKRLHGDWVSDPAIPVVTGFLGKARKSCAVTTLGRGGRDLTATTIGKALGLPDIQGTNDIPMDIVELMAKNQYERCLPDAENRNCVPKKSTIRRKAPVTVGSTIYCKGELRLQQEGPKDKHHEPYGQSGMFKTGVTVGPSQRNLVDYFSPLYGNCLNRNGLYGSPYPLAVEVSHSRKKLDGVHIPTMDPGLLGSAQTSKLNGSTPEHRSSDAISQALVGCSLHRTILQQDDEASHIWAFVTPNRVSSGYDLPKKAASQSTSADTDVISHGHGAVNKQKRKRDFDLNAEYQFPCKHSKNELHQNMRGSLDLYSNEGISGMTIG